MPRLARYLMVVIGVMGLVLVRYFETNLFYDPLDLFFQGDYLTRELPLIDPLFFWPSLIFRFLLNLIFGLMLLKGLFIDPQTIRFTWVLYLMFFAFLSLALFGLMAMYQAGYYHQLFYVRRFLIHPIILLILIPGFYFYKPK
ncbi:MAG: exosortase F system-associated protein [Flavobacteriaceae bacterium]|jgi:exosortase F-associated protein|tara:strand:+ start:29378 stop:29803 length:426 start_codon:yes stop_codon:yes gene_type:complete